ncbi:MAG: hypothetical protein PUF12_02880 [Thermoflexaceae bacterium]|nr:hypothetical protein [Thermoflexaceae bacterium]
MKDFFSNRYIRVIMVLELVILFIFIGKIFLPMNNYQISYSEMAYVNGKIVDGKGVYTNSSMGTEGYFVYGPSFDIKRGIYDVTINYEAEEDGNYIIVSGDNEDYNSILKDDFTLSPLLQSQTFTVWFNKNTNYAVFSVMYAGKGEFAVESIQVKENVSGRIYAVLKALFYITCLNFILWICRLAAGEKIKKEQAFEVLVLCGIVLIASYPLFTSFLTEGDDIVYHLLRIEGIKEGLLSGQLPVRIHPVQYRGYGYASSIFYGELLLYIPAVLRLCGVTLQNAYKIFVLLINVGTVLISWKCMCAIFKDKKIALLCCMVYALSPYRLFNIYVRSAVGEYSAMMFWPVIALGLYRLFCKEEQENKKQTAWILLTIGFTGLIQTHLLSCELAVVFSVIICLIMWKKFFSKTTFCQIGKFFLSTVCINLFYLLPFLQFMIKGGVNITDFGSIHTKMIQGNGIFPAQYLNLFVNGHGMAYGHGVSAYKGFGMSDEAGITIGLSLLAGLVVFGFLLLVSYGNVKKEKHYRMAVLTGVLGFIALVLATNVFPWDVLCRLLGRSVSTLQFPWRALSVGSILLTVTLGCVLSMISHLWDKYHCDIFVGIIIAVSLITAGYMLYDRLNTSAGMYVYDGVSLADKGSGSLDEYAPSETDWKELTMFSPIPAENLILSGYDKDYTNISLTVKETDNQPGLVAVPLLYYEGYEARDDAGNLMRLLGDDNGVMNIVVPAGFDGNITIRYVGFWYWRVAEIVSVVSFVIFLYFAVKSFYRCADIRND